MSDLRSIHWRAIRDHLQGRRQVVHDRLGLVREATGTELANLMGWPVTSIRPRLVELRDAGLCEATGERRNHEHVWRFVPLALAEQRARVEQERVTTTQQMALFA